MKWPMFETFQSSCPIILFVETLCQGRDYVTLFSSSSSKLCFLDYDFIHFETSVHTYYKKNENYFMYIFFRLHFKCDITYTWFKNH